MPSGFDTRTLRDLTYGKKQKAFSLNLNDRPGTFNTSIERMKSIFEVKKSTDLFKRKLKIIKKHLKDTFHPLRILLD